MARRALGPSSTAIHGHIRPPDGAPVSSPIYQSSTFANPVGSSDEPLYTRYGTNPNQLTIGARLAELPAHRQRCGQTVFPAHNPP